MSTIFTAEVIALRRSVKLVMSGSLEDNYLICLDSFSALQELSNVMTYDHLVHRVQLEFHQIITSGYGVTLTWVPSHVGIREMKLLILKQGIHRQDHQNSFLFHSETGIQR